MSTTAILIIGCCLITLILAGVGVYFYINRKIDCKVGEWGACSKTCGGGVKTRNVITEPKNGGASCGSLEERCNTQNCSSNDGTPTNIIANLSIQNNTWYNINEVMLITDGTESGKFSLSFGSYWRGTEYIKSFPRSSGKNFKLKITVVNPVTFSETESELINTFDITELIKQGKTALYIEGVEPIFVSSLSAPSAGDLPSYNARLTKL
jgi:hypothetical protein